MTFKDKKAYMVYYSLLAVYYFQMMTPSKIKTNKTQYTLQTKKTRQCCNFEAKLHKPEAKTKDQSWEKNYLLHHTITHIQILYIHKLKTKMLRLILYYTNKG